jgi:hypothetical protein
MKIIPNEGMSSPEPDNKPGSIEINTKPICYVDCQTAQQLADAILQNLNAVLNGSGIYIQQLPSLKDEPFLVSFKINLP